MIAINGSAECEGGSGGQASAGSEDYDSPAAATTSAASSTSAPSAATSSPPAAPPAAAVAAPPAAAPGATSLAGIWALLFSGSYLPGPSWMLDGVCRQSAHELSFFRS